MSKDGWTPQVIALTLAMFAEEYPPAPPPPNGKRSVRVDAAVFKFGTLTIRCLPFRENVQRLARKYAARDTWRWTRTWENDLLPPIPTLHRPKDADARLAALEKELAE